MPETMREEPYRFEFVGGQPCLDFTNTVGGNRRTIPTEHLHAYPDLVAWATSYYPTPSALLAGPRRASGSEQEPGAVLDGGRAPGTLASQYSRKPR